MISIVHHRRITCDKEEGYNSIKLFISRSKGIHSQSPEHLSQHTVRHRWSAHAIPSELVNSTASSQSNARSKKYSAILRIILTSVTAERPKEILQLPPIRYHKVRVSMPSTKQIQPRYYLRPLAKKAPQGLDSFIKGENQEKRTRQQIYTQTAMQQQSTLRIGAS